MTNLQNLSLDKTVDKQRGKDLLAYLSDKIFYIFLMRKRKIDPNSFQARAEAKYRTTGGLRIDLAREWSTGEDTELDPRTVASLSDARSE